MKKIFIASVPMIGLLSLSVHAEQAAFDPNGQYMLGDWQGKRTELAAQGIKFEANAAVDVAYVANGGHEEGDAPTYASQYWLGSQLDMDKLAGWTDTTIRAVVTARQGQSTTLEDIQGSAPQMANVQGNFGRGNSKSRLTELSIEKNFKQQGISIKAGRLGLGMDFNVMACDFQSTAFCAAQMGKWQGNMWMNTPVSQWGARVKYQLDPEWFTQVGVYEFNPENALERHGWNIDMDEADGVSIPVEVVWQPKQAINGLAGSYRLGAMYNTANELKNQKDVRTGEAEDRTFAAWLAVEQQLTSIGEGKRGLHTFANFTWHDRVTNKVADSQQLGFKYIGLMATQPNDILGFAVNRVHLNERFSEGKAQFNEDAEYNLELNYSYYPTKWLMLRPNVQYVIHSGASNLADDALVLGLGSRIVF